MDPMKTDDTVSDVDDDISVVDNNRRQQQQDGSGKNTRNPIGVGDPSVVGNISNRNSNNILNTKNIDGGNDSRITFASNSGKSSDSSTKINPPVVGNNPKDNSVAGNRKNINSNNIMNSNNERGGNNSPISFG